ncbi:MAG: glycosyltransferase [Planctomycetaceae bacterium]|nr:glycosyltransferase [Planctomycetaceae bacterium]
MTLSSGSVSNQLTMVITELDVGGAERAFVRIAIGLKSLGWNVRVISLWDAGQMADPLRQAGIAVEALGCHGAYDIRAVGRLQRALQANPPAALLTFLHQANIAGRIAAKRVGIRTVVCGVRVADRRLSVRWPELLTKKYVTHYVAVSHAVAKAHQELCHIDPRHFSVIYNGVDHEEIEAAPVTPRHELNCTDDDQVILCVGRLSPQKAPLDVVEAIDELRKLAPESYARRKLVFVGSGPLLSALRTLIADRKLENHVHLIGWRADVVSVMKSATLLVLASRWEGLPNVILEAQTAGLPVVAAAVDGCREVIEDGQTGRLFPPGNKQRLAEILQELLEEKRLLNHAAPKSLEALAIKGRAFASRFSWEKCIAEYDVLLRNLQSAESDASRPPHGR